MSVNVKSLIISITFAFLSLQNSVFAGELKSLRMDSFSVVDITNAVSKALNTDPQNPNAPKKDLLDSSDEAVKIINMVQVNKQALFIKLSF